MNIFADIVKSVLKESAPSVSQIIDAIDKKYQVKINYDGPEPDGKGERTIEPVTYGLSRIGRKRMMAGEKGNPVIRAFQPFGDTSTSRPNWKLFRIDRIVDWNPIKDAHFNEPPYDYYSNEGEKYNPNGDGSMSVVYKSADFTQNNYEDENGADYDYGGWYNKEYTPNKTQVNRPSRKHFLTPKEKELFQRKMNNAKLRKKYGVVDVGTNKKDSLEDKYKDMLAQYKNNTETAKEIWNNEEFWKKKSNTSGLGPLNKSNNSNQSNDTPQTTGLGPLENDTIDSYDNPNLSMSPEELEDFQKRWTKR